MSNDGAFYGMDAESAMHAVIGGSGEEEPPLATREQRRAEIEATTFAGHTGGPSAYTYDTSAKAAAKIILQTIEANPDVLWAEIPTEAEYEYLDENGAVIEDREERFKGTFTMAREGWMEVMKPLMSAENTAEWETLGLTGFQWGWAVNTVRWILDMPPVGNPAIITIGGKD